jgi:hypothetical protein
MRVRSARTATWASSVCCSASSVAGQQRVGLGAQEVGQVLAGRAGAGSIPACFNISHTVDAATFTPSTSSSPCRRRYPQLGFSRARRSTRTRTERTVGGRPGRFGRDRCAWRRAKRSRCQRRTVSGAPAAVFDGAPRAAPGAAGLQERPGTRVEPHPFATQLPFQHRELVAQRQDLHVLVAIAHRQQTQEGERVRHAKVGQSQQHG